ncbi:hypothetical protein FW774_09605 [Pedobacter sp. BS3]|uniref:hypothetical protein n=1 Tax=Pedobacter sp. BS3 TaxID=2567937 RepID=UPI0011EF5EDA|nr:hypothetical protein [Pedobacter sp. BS3]TZF83718.1 hypothetical protein FW774_09605 [Pedobacter sp. BS3]
MKRNFLIVLMLIIGFISCSKDNDKETLSGVYAETSPVEGRSQLTFISKNKVVKTESGSSVKDEFNYSISGNKIKLTPTWDNSPSVELGFKLINSSTFEIEDLYPHIPEYPTTYMTFQK